MLICFGFCNKSTFSVCAAYVELDIRQLEREACDLFDAAVSKLPTGILSAIFE